MVFCGQYGSVCVSLSRGIVTLFSLVACSSAFLWPVHVCMQDPATTCTIGTQSANSTSESPFVLQS